MVASSALFTENVYRKYIAPNASDRHYTRVGRLVTVVTVAVGIAFAFGFESVVTGLEVFWKVSAMMGLAFWAGLFWRRTTPAGAWAGTLTCLVLFLATSSFTLPGVGTWDFNAHAAAYLPEFMLFEGQLYLPWQMILYLSAGLAVLVVVSLLTRPVPEEKLERFYACLRTPVREEEPETAPFTLPPGVKPAPRRLLVNIPGFEIPRPSLVSVVGVLLAAAASVLLVGGVYWLFSLGQ
jgi:Na+/proline symporter